MVAIWRDGRREHWPLGVPAGQVRPPTLDEVLAERRLTVEEYHRLAELGYLNEDDHIELIDGELYQMAAQGGPHILCVIRGTNLFATLLAGRAFAGSQIAISLPPDSEPEPDLAIVRLVGEDVDSYLPVAADVFFLVEVARTSLNYDRGAKLSLYARHGIPEVWIVNLNAYMIEVYREPRDGAYTSLTLIGRDDQTAPLAFPDVAVRGSDLLGRA